MTSRRNLIKLSGAALVPLAGCISPEDNTQNPPEQTPDDDENETSTETETPNEETPNEETPNEETPNEETPNEETESADPDVTVTLNNEGSSAWVITGVDNSSTVGETEVSNPEITLQTGTRYRFVNNGGSFHPLAFRSTNDSALLSQSNNGEFEDRESVNWSDQDEFVEFTLTSELASELDEYYCTVHSSMVGSIQTQ